MWFTAAIIGIGIFVLFFDLPKKAQNLAMGNMWFPHLLVFFFLVAIHGGSAEGTVIAGIATIIFRWCLHRLHNRRLKQAGIKDPPATQGPIIISDEDRTKYRQEVSDDNLRCTLIILPLLLTAFLIIGLSS